MGEKTNDLLEIGKLNSRIHAEEDAIEQHKFDLGDYTWEKFQTGVAMDERTTVICMAIRERQENMQSMREEIDAIKRAKDTGRQRAYKPAPTPPEAAMKTCPVCGGLVAAGCKFCGDCGTQLH
ncbi:MAG: hypothetical protein EOM66_10120 [Clostridia bacterium]|nr:hypothetical protein [Clostridia bacterium]